METLPIELFELIVAHLPYKDYTVLTCTSKVIRRKIIDYWPRQTLEINSDDDPYLMHILCLHNSIFQTEILNFCEWGQPWRLQCQARKINGCVYMAGPFKLSKKQYTIKLSGYMDNNVPNGTCCLTIIRKGNYLFSSTEVDNHTKYKFKDGKLHGDCVSYYDLRETLTKSIVPYIDGKVHGQRKIFHLDQTIDTIDHYRYGEKQFGEKSIKLEEPSIFQTMWETIFR